MNPVQPSWQPLESFFAHTGGTPLTAAFDGRGGVHPTIGLTPVPPAETAAVWQTLQTQPCTGPAVAYLHVPFCDGRCTFCNFYRNPWRATEGPAYVDAVIEQLRRGQDTPLQASAPIQAVYFGGGTPTLLAARDLARLIEAVRDYLPLTPDCEITIEGRTYGFGLDKGRAAFAAGANRLSIGVQTFDDRCRRRLGRRTPRRDLITFLEQLVAADQAAIVIDLIYGLPEQRLADWETEVRSAIDIGLDGVTLYALNLVPGTPLASAHEAGQICLPPAPEHGSYYARGAELLAAARWRVLSNSHWRRTTRERNRYNLVVKGGATCLAFGAGAGGFHAGYSFRHMAAPGDFQASIARGDLTLAGLMRHSPYHRLFGLIKAGMAQCHLDCGPVAAALDEAAGLDLEAVAGPLLAQWEDAGLLERDGNWIDLTVAGCYWQVRLTQNLLEWLNQCIVDATRAHFDPAQPA